MAILTDLSKKLQDLFNQGSKSIAQNAQSFNNNVTRPLQNNVFSPTVNNVNSFANNVGKTISKQPVLNNPLPPLPQFKIQIPTIEQAVNQGVKNAQTSLQQSGQFSRAIGTPTKLQTPQQQQLIKQNIPNVVGNISGFAKPQFAKFSAYLKQVAKPEDINLIKNFAAWVEKTGGKGNPTKVGIDLPSIQAMARDVFGDKATNLNNKQLKNLFDATLEEVGKGKNSLNLGLGNVDIRKETKTGLSSDLKTQQPILKDTRDLSLQPKLVEATPPKSGSGQPPSSSRPSSPIIPNQKYAYNINKNRLDLNPQEAAVFDDAVNTIRPELEKIKGKTVTFDDVRADAKSADLLKRAIPRESTKAFEASLHATRERMTILDVEITRLIQTGNGVEAQRLTQELMELIKVNSSQAADIGRKLGSFRIMAEERPFRERVLDEIIRTGKLTDEMADDLTKKASTIDWNDAREVTKLFQNYIKPSIGKMLEEYRYMNLLSSPKTHIVNSFSNILQAAFTRPTTKLASGIIDNVAAALTGKQREFYIREVPIYYRGLISSVPKAFEALKNVMSGKTPIRNLDMKQLQSGTALSKVNVISKALSGMDEFFQTLISGAEREAFGYKFARMGKKIEDADLQTLVKQEAQYSVFRQPLDTANTTGQGNVLTWIDKGTEAILGLRRVPGIGWFIPFVQTPMNIFKQGIEYSPMGVSTLIGATNKTEQLAKAMVGSTVFMGAGYLAMQDKLSWDTPKDPEAKKLFYAAGMQPYSMKIGNKWVSYSKLGPLAYPLALAAAIKYSYTEDPKSDSNGSIDKVTNSLGGILGFFGDQTYVQGLGNLVKAAQGEEGYSGSTATIGNIATQYVPLSSLLRWITTIIDPIYRKSDGVVDQIKKGIPIISGDVGYYEDPFGEPSRRQMPGVNALSPLSVTQENPELKEMYDLRSEELKNNATIKSEEKKLEKELLKNSGMEAGAAETTTNIGDLRNQKKLEMEEKIAKKKVELEGGFKKVGDKYIYADAEGKSKTLTLTPPTKGTGIGSFANTDYNATKAVSIWNNPDIPQELKDLAFKELKVDPQDVRYAALSKYNTDVSTQYIISKSQDHDTLIESLLTGRVVGITGSQFANNAVIDSLYSKGLISKEEQVSLKKIKVDKNGKNLVATKISSKKPKKITIKASTVAKIKPFKLSQSKAPKIKIGKNSITKIAKFKTYKLVKFKIAKTKTRFGKFTLTG